MGTWKNGINDTLFPSDPKYWTEKRRREKEEEDREIRLWLEGKILDSDSDTPKEPPNNLESFMK